MSNPIPILPFLTHPLQAVLSVCTTNAMPALKAGLSSQNQLTQTMATELQTQKIAQSFHPEARKEEIQQIAALLASSSPGIIMLVGHSGAGKTTIVEYLALNSSKIPGLQNIRILNLNFSGKSQKGWIHEISESLFKGSPSADFTEEFKKIITSHLKDPHKKTVLFIDEFHLFVQKHRPIFEFFLNELSSGALSLIGATTDFDSIKRWASTTNGMDRRVTFFHIEPMDRSQMTQLIQSMTGHRRLVIENDALEAFTQYASTLPGYFPAKGIKLFEQFIHYIKGSDPQLSQINRQCVLAFCQNNQRLTTSWPHPAIYKLKEELTSLQSYSEHEPTMLTSLPPVNQDWTEIIHYLKSNQIAVVTSSSERHLEQFLKSPQTQPTCCISLLTLLEVSQYKEALKDLFSQPYPAGSRLIIVCSDKDVPSKVIKRPRSNPDHSLTESFQTTAQQVMDFLNSPNGSFIPNVEMPEPPSFPNVSSLNSSKEADALDALKHWVNQGHQCIFYIKSNTRASFEELQNGALNLSPRSFRYAIRMDFRKIIQWIHTHVETPSSMTDTDWAKEIQLVVSCFKEWSVVDPDFIYKVMESIQTKIAETSIPDLLTSVLLSSTTLSPETIRMTYEKRKKFIDQWMTPNPPVPTGLSLNLFENTLGLQQSLNFSQKTSLDIQAQDITTPLIQALLHQYPDAIDGSLLPSDLPPELQFYWIQEKFLQIHRGSMPSNPIIILKTEASSSDLLKSCEANHILVISYANHPSIQEASHSTPNLLASALTGNLFSRIQTIASSMLPLLPSSLQQTLETHQTAPFVTEKKPYLVQAKSELFMPYFVQNMENLGIDTQHSLFNPLQAIYRLLVLQKMITLNELKQSIEFDVEQLKALKDKPNLTSDDLKTIVNYFYDKHKLANPSLDKQELSYTCSPSYSSYVFYTLKTSQKIAKKTLGILQNLCWFVFPYLLSNYLRSRK